MGWRSTGRSFLVPDDLARLPLEKPVIAEGAALLPKLVAPLLSDVHQAIWIVPTENLARPSDSGARGSSRSPTNANPHTAWESWMARDAAFARHIASQAIDRKMAFIWVDGQRTVGQVREAVEAWVARCLSQ